MGKHVIFVFSQPLTKYGRDAINHAKGFMRVEDFHENELVVNITRHERVPTHVPLSSDDKQALLRRYTMSNTSLLPRIMYNDPVARYFGLKKDDVVMIIRQSDTCGSYKTYRVVV